jgi:hypothetical protein
MDESVLRKFIRELHDELRRINEVIVSLERIASRPRRGRKRKFGSELARRILRRRGSEPRDPR